MNPLDWQKESKHPSGSSSRFSITNPTGSSTRVLVAGIALTWFLGTGCQSKPLTSPPHPQSGDELSLTVKPPKPIEKRLFPLKVVRKERVELNGTAYTVFVMDLPAMTLEGLAGLQRVDLPENTGMILVYPEGDPPAVSMERNLFDIDVLYLNPKGVITLIATEPESAPPLPKQPARFILEIPKGEALRLGAKVGQTVVLPKDLLEIKSTDVNVTPEKTTAPGTTQSGSATPGN